MGGQVDHPTYEAVCSGRTGHAEAVRITFDSTVVSYRELLEVLFVIHDPATPNRQGHDVGTQYRAVVFHHAPEQIQIAEEMIAVVTKEKLSVNPIVTEITPAGTWCDPEPYHHEYFSRNPFQGYCPAIVGPKVAKFRKLFTANSRRNAAPLSPRMTAPAAITNVLAGVVGPETTETERNVFPCDELS